MDYTAYQEECDYQLNAHYDYVSEAFGGDVESQATLDAEAEYYDYLNLDAAMDAMEARGGPAYHFDTDPIPF
jgi:hypothetical protein